MVWKPFLIFVCTLAAFAFGNSKHRLHLKDISRPEKDEDITGEELMSIRRNTISKLDGKDLGTITFKDLSGAADGELIESNFGSLTCTYQAKFGKCRAEFLPVKGLCNELPSFTSFLTRFYPDVAMLKASSNVIHPDKFDIESFVIDRCEAKQVTFRLFSEESMNAVERYLIVNNAKFSLSFPYEFRELNLAAMTISGDAMTTIGDRAVKVRVEKKVNTTMLEFEMDTIEEVKFAAIAKKFHFDINKILTDESGPAKAALNLEALSFRKATLTGSLAKGEAFEFLIKGEVANCPLLQDASKTYLLIQRYMTETKQPKVAIYSIFDKSLYGLLKLLSMDQDLPDITLYSQVKRFLFTVASDSYIVINTKPAKQESLEFVSGRFKMDAISFGAEVRFKVPQPTTLARRDDTKDNTAIVKLNITEDALRASFPDDIQGSLTPLIATVWNNANLKADDLPFPSDVTVKLQYARIGLQVPRYVNITCMITLPYVIVPGVLTLTGVNFKVFTKGSAVAQFDQWRLDNAKQRETTNGTLDINIIEDKDNTYCIQGNLAAETFKDVQKFTKANLVPEDYQNIFEEVMNMPLKEIKFESPLAKQKLDFVRILGTALLIEGKEIPLDGVFTQENEGGLAVGLNFVDYQLNTILELIYGERMLISCWLKFQEAGVLFSGKDLPKYKLKTSPLSEINIKKGVQFVGKMTLRLSDCQDDQLCEYIYRYIAKEVVTTFTGTMSPEDGYKFTATFNKIYQLSNNVMMLDNRFEVSGKGEPSSMTKLIGKMKLQNENIEFEASIWMSHKGRLTLAGQVDSWSQPIGLTAGLLKDIKLDQGIDELEKPGFLYFKGKLLYGDEGTNKIKTDITLIYDLGSEQSHYLHGEIYHLGMVQFANALNIHVEHNVLKGMEFNSTVTLQYSAAKKKFKAPELSRPLLPGKLVVVGFARVLGSVVPTTILVKDYGFRIKSVYSNITIGKGFISIRKGDRGSGPRFIGKIFKTRSNVALKGNFVVMGIKGINELQFAADQTARLEVKGKLLDMIDGTYTLASKYQSLDDMIFSFDSVPTQDALNQCIHGIETYVQKLRTEVTNENQKMDKIRQSAKDSYEYIGEENVKIKEMLYGIEANIYRRSVLMEKAKGAITRDCVSECQPGCYHGVTWNPRCTKLNDHNYGCTGWSNCDSKAADTPCIARCEAGKVISNIKAYDEHAQIKSLIDDYKDGNIELKKTDDLLDKAKKIMNQIKEMQDRINSISALVSEAENLTSVETRKEKPIAIEEFRVSGGFNFFDPFKYPIKIVARIGGNSYSYSTNITVDSLVFDEIAKMIMEDAIPRLPEMEYEIGNITMGHIRAEKLIEDFKAAAKKKQTDCEEDFLEPKQAQTRDYIPSEKELEFYKIAQEPIPQYLTKSQETIRAFVEDSSWSIAARHKIEETPGSSSYSRKNRTLSTGDPCMDISNVILDYEDIVHGMDDIADNFKRTTAGFPTMEKRLVSEAKVLKQEISSLGAKYDANEAELVDMDYWPSEIEEGAKRWIDANRDHINEQNERGLQIFARQLTSAIQQDKQSGLHEHLVSLTRAGTTALQSDRIQRRDVLPLDSLHHIHKRMTKLLTSEVPLSDSKEHIEELKHHLNLVKRSVASCS